MAMASVNGMRLSYEISGAGDIPLVLVHGSWVSRHSWDLVVPGLAESLRVLTYDRRGHSERERPTRQGSVHEDVADLAAPHRACGTRARVGGWNSFGASITLRLAGKHPDLFRGVLARTNRRCFRSPGTSRMLRIRTPTSKRPWISSSSTRAVSSTRRAMPPDISACDIKRPCCQAAEFVHNVTLDQSSEARDSLAHGLLKKSKPGV